MNKQNKLVYLYRYNKNCAVVVLICWGHSVFFVTQANLKLSSFISHSSWKWYSKDKDNLQIHSGCSAFVTICPHWLTLHTFLISVVDVSLGYSRFSLYGSYPFSWFSSLSLIHFATVEFFVCGVHQHILQHTSILEYVMYAAVRWDRDCIFHDVCHRRQISFPYVVVVAQCCVYSGFSPTLWRISKVDKLCYYSFRLQSPGWQYLRSAHPTSKNLTRLRCVSTLSLPKVIKKSIVWRNIKQQIF